MLELGWWRKDIKGTHFSISDLSWPILGAASSYLITSYSKFNAKKYVIWLYRQYSWLVHSWIYRGINLYPIEPPFIWWEKVKNHGDLIIYTSTRSLFEITLTFLFAGQYANNIHNNITINFLLISWVLWTNLCSSSWKCRSTKLWICFFIFCNYYRLSWWYIWGSLDFIFYLITESSSLCL